MKKLMIKRKIAIIWHLLCVDALFMALVSFMDLGFLRFMVYGSGWLLTAVLAILNAHTGGLENV